MQSLFRTMACFAFMHDVDIAENEHLSIFTLVHESHLRKPLQKV